MESYIQHYSLVGLIRAGIRMYVRQFASFVAISLVLYVPFLVAGQLVMWWALAFSAELGLSLVVPIWFFGIALAEFALIGQASRVCYGVRASVREGITGLNARGVAKLMGTLVLSALAAMAWFLAAILPAAALDVAFSSLMTETEWYVWILFASVIVGYVAAIAALVRYSFIPWVVVLERRYWREAIRRSAWIVKSRIWRVVGYHLVSVTVGTVLVSIPVLAMAMIAALLEAEPSQSVPILLVVVVVLLLPLYSSFTTLFYYSLRIEKRDLTSEDMLDIRSFEIPE